MSIRKTTAVIGACAAMMAVATTAYAQERANAQIMNAEGKSLGTLQLTQSADGVKIAGNVTGLPAGTHAFHIHQTGKCEPPFTSAGGHYNPTNAKHGKDVEGGPHAGDMNNIEVAQDGSFTFNVVSTMVSLKKGEKATLFDDDGSAIVIHAKPDDYKSQPSGDAGDRIACGIVKAADSASADAPAKTR